MASTYDIAWAAGLFEGEGSIVCYPIPRRINSIRTSLSLQMSDQDVVRRFGEIVGCGSLLGPYKGQRSGNKDKFLWQAQNFRDCMYVLGQIYPYLGERRRAKADYMLDNCIGRYMYFEKYVGTGLESKDEFNDNF